MTHPSDLIDPTVLARARAVRDAREARAHGQHLSVVDERPIELTTRRLEVLELLATGLSNAEIGAQLFVSAQTIASHVKTVLAILGARNRTHAVAIALQTGLLPTQATNSRPESELAPTERKDGTMPTNVANAIVTLLESLAKLVDSATELVKKEAA